MFPLINKRENGVNLRRIMDMLGVATKDVEQYSGFERGDKHMKLYHYRSIDNAIKEIENRTFRYSDRLEVNDPLEGYIRVYWKGDRIAWEGLFRNYICSLWQCIAFYHMGIEYEEIEANAVIIDIHHFDNVPMGEIFKVISTRFIENDYIQKIMKYLDEKQISCSAKSLRMLLRLLHEIAFSICINKMKEEKLINDNQNEYVLATEKVLEELINAETEQMSVEQMKVMFESAAIIVEDMIESIFLMKGCETNTYSAQSQNWMKVRLDFPSVYVSKLQEIIYPKAYFVCFSSDNTNSAMWGNYADNHTGVCLIYQTRNVNGKETLSVKSKVVYGNEKSFLFRDDEVKAVTYNHMAIQRNFFESLGRLTYLQIESWLVSGDEKKSELLERYLEEDWRNKYWVDYDEKYCMKLPAWKHEKEYRLLITDSFYEYTPEDRFIKYNQEQLVGVIFGIKTSECDKFRIINALKKSDRNLDDFEFYQAEYDDEDQTIKVRGKYLFDKTIH